MGDVVTDTRPSLRVKKEVLEKLGMTDERRKEIRKEWAAKGKKGKELAEAVKWEVDEFISKHISEYATTNEREFFAECFSEYMTSPEPREAAKIFGEIFEKLVRKLK